MPRQPSAFEPSPLRVNSVTLVVKSSAEGTKTDLQHDVKDALGPEWKIARLFETDLGKPALMRWPHDRLTHTT